MRFLNAADGTLEIMAFVVRVIHKPHALRRPSSSQRPESCVKGPQRMHHSSTDVFLWPHNKSVNS